MNVVVDTNVVAYYLLATQPFAEEARRFWHAVESASAPAHWEAELTNVIWMAVRTSVLAADEAHRRLDFAARLGIETVSIRSLWQSALASGVKSGLTAYDTLFVELAIGRNLPLATFDKKVLRAFPRVARRPASLMPERE